MKIALAREAKQRRFQPCPCTDRNVGIYRQLQAYTCIIKRTNMPLVRIDIDASTSPEIREAIGAVVYDAMTSTAKVPANDKFMIVSTHSAGDLIFPKEGYLGV